MSSYKGYCLKEKKTVVIKDAKVFKTARGALMIRGECPCGTKVTTFSKVPAGMDLSKVPLAVSSAKKKKTGSGSKRSSTKSKRSSTKSKRSGTKSKRSQKKKSKRSRR